MRRGGGRRRGEEAGVDLTFQIKLFKFKSKSSYRYSSHSFSHFCPPLPPSLHQSGLLLTDLLFHHPPPPPPPFPSSPRLISFFLLPLLLFTTFERLAVWRTALSRAFFKSGTSKESVVITIPRGRHVCI